MNGVEPQTETVWHQADHYRVPRVGYVNKMDRPGADFYQAVEDVRTKLGANPVPIQIPIGKEAGYVGMIDLLTMEEVRFDPATDGTEMIRSPIAAERFAEAEKWKEHLVDSLSSFSDEITGLFLEGKTPPVELLKQTIRRATLDRAIVPMLCGASRRNMGVQPLIDAIVDYLPAPDEVEPTIGHHQKKDEPVPVPCKADGNPLGLVFKIQNDREAGSLCYVRMYSGSIKTGSTVYNLNKKKRERVNRILRMHANRSEPMDQVSAGDIAVFVGMKLAQTGDTVGSEGWPVLLEKMAFPIPVIMVAIEPKTTSERDRLREVLDILAKEDPTFTTREDEETGQLIISGMGELHLDVLVTRIIDEFKVGAKVGNPQVTYRESITKETSHTEKFRRAIAGKDNEAGLTLAIKPLPRGSGNVFSISGRKDKIPEEILDAIERGVTSSFSTGIQFGYPSIDIGVTVTDVDYNENTSTPFAFEACSSMGFDAACRDAGPVLLEPIMKVDVTTPRDFVGEAISLLSQRGGLITSTESKVSTEVIHAQAPLAVMFGFSTSLRSVSQGRASFAMEFSHFEKKAN